MAIVDRTIKMPHAKTAQSTLRRVETRCLKGHLLPPVQLRDGEEMTQVCGRCGGKVKIQVYRHDKGHLAFTTEFPA